MDGNLPEVHGGNPGTDLEGRDREGTPTRAAPGGPLVYTPKLIHLREARAERWALKATASRLLPKGHKTSKCHHWRVPDKRIDVHGSGDHGKAFYTGLQVCGSVWVCPICATKISERRRAELAGAVTVAKAMGLQAFLLTLTIPHGLGDDVADMLERMGKAWASMNQGKAGMGLRQRLHLEGTVRALEVTHGVNGWHPHYHALLFLRPGITPHQVEAILGPVWQKSAVKAGLPRPSDERGCRVDGGEKAAAYIAKGSSWGLESEVVKGHLKKGKRGSRSPFDLLRSYQDGDKQAGALFLVYAKAFHGRRQLYWSNGLKARLGVKDLDDLLLASLKEDESARHLAHIRDEQWREIRRQRLQAHVLDLAETDPDQLYRLLASLVRTGVPSKLDEQLSYLVGLGWSDELILRYMEAQG